MKTLAIIGGNGMLGSDLVRYLSPKFRVTSINRENYSQRVGGSFDVLINANGNSKRFWANKNPQEDFLKSTVSVYRSMFDFSCDIYIYISSPDVYANHSAIKYTKEDGQNDPEKLSPYGFHKYLSEIIVKKYKKNFFILRPSMMLGTELKKGPFFDIVHDNPLSITPQSCLQLITTSAVAEIIQILLKNSKTASVLNLGGIGTFPFRKISKYFNKEIKIKSDAVKQVYEMNVKKIKYLYPDLKTSEEYLFEYLNKK